MLVPLSDAERLAWRNLSRLILGSLLWTAAPFPALFLVFKIGSTFFVIDQPWAGMSAADAPSPSAYPPLFAILVLCYVFSAFLLPAALRAVVNLLMPERLNLMRYVLETLIQGIWIANLTFDFFTLYLLLFAYTPETQQLFTQLILIPYSLWFLLLGLTCVLLGGYGYRYGVLARWINLDLLLCGSLTVFLSILQTNPKLPVHQMNLAIMPFAIAYASLGFYFWWGSAQVPQMDD